MNRGLGYENNLLAGDMGTLDRLSVCVQGLLQCMLRFLPLG